MDRVIKKVERNVTKTITKEGKALVKETGKGIMFIEAHAKEIKEVVDTTADIIAVVGLATGNPEITAAAEGLKAGADTVLDLLDKAGKVQDAAEKALLVAQAIAEKKKLGEIISKTGDAMESAGKASGNKRLEQIGGHIKRGGVVIDKAVDHGEKLIGIGKDVVKAVKSKNLKAGIKATGEGVKEVGKVVKTVKQTKKLVKEVKDTLDGKEPTTKAKPTKVTKTTTKVTSGKKEKEKMVKVKSDKPTTKTTKKKRAPSAYNIFIGAHIKAGGTFKSGVAAWNLQKTKTN